MILEPYTPYPDPHQNKPEGIAFQHFLESRVIGRPYFSLLIYKL